MSVYSISTFPTEKKAIYQNELFTTMRMIERKLLKHARERQIKVNGETTKGLKI